MDLDLILYEGKFEYLINSDGRSWKIEWKGKYQPFPTSLYKYFPCNLRAIKAIEQCELYASTPEKLNDLFDSPFHSVTLEISDLQSVKELFTSSDDIDEDKFKISEKYRSDLRNTIYALINQSLGVLSTTSDCINDLMWSHYAKHDGFCVKYNYKKFPSHFGEPIPVSYLEPLEFLDLKEDKLAERFLFNYLRKKKVWAYERELRFLLVPPNKGSFLTDGAFSNLEFNFSNSIPRVLKYPTDSVEEIILGFNFFKALMKEGNKLNFGFRSGKLRLRLLQFAINNEIAISMIHINLQTRQFEKRPIRIIKHSTNLYEFVYI